MNRLVIIGNGFDLAHGLPTKYSDFIDWYWGKVFFVKDKYTLQYKDDLLQIELSFGSQYDLNALDIFQNLHSYPDYRKFIDNHRNSQITGRKNFDHKIKFTNAFFGVICNSYLKKWVDIENDYYQLLIKCLKEDRNIEVLNQEFEEVKKLFQTYLEEVVEKIDYTNKINSDILNLFEYKFDSTLPIVFNEKNQVNNNYLKEFPKNTHQEVIDYNNWINPNTSNQGKSMIKPFTLFLNFNYTSLVRAYIDEVKSKKYDLVYENQIHGSLENTQFIPNDNNERNKMIFGFGDEMDDDYKAIEKKNDNNYFKNIKSFGYFQTNDYRNLRNSIDSGYFQVLVMGHSCGLSDRVLLNTIFEHPNCCSIKVFYHENKEKQTDNYNDIVQNISRHFNKKEMMRERIVPKNLCKPLPQIKLH
jgi:Bacteriophage abortive infection AbiH